MDLVIVLEAAEFCATNWTYRPDFRELLGLPPRSNFPIVRCVQCGFVFAHLRPDDNFLRRVYEEVIRADDCVTGSENRDSYTTRLRYVATLLQLAPETPRALDFGSGAGVTLRILAACGVEAIGYDPSATRSGYTRSKNAEIAGTLDDVRARAPFSIVVLDNVLEHLPDPRAAMTFMRGVTTDDAVAYVSVPPYEQEFLQQQVERHRKGEPVDMTLNPWEHLNYFSLRHLDSLMNDAGFRRLRAGELAEPPAIGLRAERAPVARWKNAVATLPRIAKYAMNGAAVDSAGRAFYQRVR